MKHDISRKDFLQKSTFAASALLLSSLEGWALETKEKKIRVGIIGCGSVSNRYLPHLKTSPLIEIVSVCDIIYERALKQAKDYDVPNSYPHIDKMLSGAPFDM